jgi:hypothetical protein
MSSLNYPSGGRYFSNSINIEHTHPVLLQIFDSTVLWTDASSRIKTGAWRPAVPSDFAANINISGGLSVQIGAVAITGNPQVTATISNPLLTVSGVSFINNSIVPVSGITSINNSNLSVSGNVTVLNGVLPVSGNVNITNAILPVSGNVTVSTGSYQVFITGFSNGQNQIPTGAKQWGVSCISGNMFIGGILFPVGAGIAGGGYDGNKILRTAINYGCTGGYVLASWEV